MDPVGMAIGALDGLFKFVLFLIIIIGILLGCLIYNCIGTTGYGFRKVDSRISKCDAKMEFCVLEMKADSCPAQYAKCLSEIK